MKGRNKKRIENIRLVILIIFFVFDIIYTNIKISEFDFIAGIIGIARIIIIGNILSIFISEKIKEYIAMW